MQCVNLITKIMIEIIYLLLASANIPFMFDKKISIVFFLESLLDLI